MDSAERKADSISNLGIVRPSNSWSIPSGMAPTESPEKNSSNSLKPLLSGSRKDIAISSSL